MRRIARMWLIGLVAGAALVSGALAGVVVAPVPDAAPEGVAPALPQPRLSKIHAADEVVLPLRVMSYNVLHGQPCSGGSVGSEVAPRAALAVGGNGDAPGLAALAPDIMGMQEVSQVLVTQSLEENLTCRIFETFFGLDPKVKGVDGYEHQGDLLVRLLNAADALAGGDAPYKMRFVRDNPRVVPLAPDVAAPPDDETFSDRSTRDGNIEIGLGLISRHRIQQVVVHNLTIGEVPGETRALMHATVRIATPDGEVPIDVYDSHLTTTGGDSPQTVAMAAEIARFIRTTRRHPENPGIFTCDCNATPGSGAYQVFDGAGFVDTYAEAHGGLAEEDWTSGRDGLSDSCEEFPPEGGERIDYVWQLPDAGGAIAPVLSSDVVMDFSLALDDEECLWPSDHNGVLTVLDWSAREAA